MTIAVRIYLVRHGETEENKTQIAQGQLDTQLNETGVDQARLVAKALENVPFVAAVSSDLSRASKTARIILEKHPDVRLSLTESLRERHLGDWQGQHFFGRSDPPRGAEPIIDFMTRGTRWYNALVQRYLQAARTASREPGDANAEVDGAGAVGEVPTVLAVSHGGVIGGLVKNLVGSRKVRLGEGVRKGKCLNTSVSVIEVDAESGRGVVVKYGDVSHLSGDVVETNADVQETEVATGAGAGTV